MRWAMTAEICHFNPRSPHGERPLTASIAGTRTAISIHAPRTGSDPVRCLHIRGARHFNPRSPHGERPRRLPTRAKSSNFNPRSPHGERPALSSTLGEDKTISIHAPRTGSDRDTLKQQLADAKFQSTLPARGATEYFITYGRTWEISIHAPRTGSDRNAETH